MARPGLLFLLAGASCDELTGACSALRCASASLEPSARPEPASHRGQEARAVNLQNRHRPGPVQRRNMHRQTCTHRPLGRRHPARRDGQASFYVRPLFQLRPPGQPPRPGQPMMELSMHERMCRGCMAPSSISSSLPARTAAGRAAGQCAWQAQRPGDGEHRLRACSSNITRVGANGRGAFVCAALLFPSALVPPGPPDIRVQTHGRPRPDPDLPAASVRLHACMHHSGALSHGMRCTRT